MAGVKKDTANAAAEVEAAAVDNSTNEPVNADNGAAGTADTAKKEPEIVKLIYIGPTLPKAALKSNSIFDGTEADIKAYLKPVIDKYPLVEKLLVTTDGLAEKKDKVQTSGNILNKYYSDLVSLAAAELAKED